eukprot:TRINITY_DN1251_c0_g1_i1.p1 TRINITY_DN1251_c0_g1~~TRINITY_DN1251_c0_g1_i1.p1  ORF type:complete len:100 (-),score=23.85 TRINITY_DN1251_c0_g1_i1:271-570(-)
MKLFLLTIAIALAGVSAVGWGYGDDCNMALPSCESEFLECRGSRCLWKLDLECTTWKDCPAGMGYNRHCPLDTQECTCIPGHTWSNEGMCMCDPNEMDC